MNIVTVIQDSYQSFSCMFKSMKKLEEHYKRSEKEERMIGDEV